VSSRQAESYSQDVAALAGKQADFARDWPAPDLPSPEVPVGRPISSKNLKPMCWDKVNYDS